LHVDTRLHFDDVLVLDAASNHSHNVFSLTKHATVDESRLPFAPKPLAHAALGSARRYLDGELLVGHGVRPAHADLARISRVMRYREVRRSARDNLDLVHAFRTRRPIHSHE